MTKIIKVPASTANLGCGFDSLGMALKLYLTVEIVEPSDAWIIEHDFGPQIPMDKNNLIIQTALKIEPTLPPHHLKMRSEIPLEHGLGSSSSAIVAGIKIAEVIGNRGMSILEQLEWACQIEGHPDNVVPTLLGGLQVASYDADLSRLNEENLTFLSLPVPTCSMIAFVPNYSLSTKAARNVLPASFARQKAVMASSKANVLVAALTQRKLIPAGKMMESDLFHEGYRSTLIPELAKIRAIAHQHQAYATYLSGAGSTIMTWLPKEHLAEFKADLKDFSNTHQGDILELKVDTKGARVK